MSNTLPLGLSPTWRCMSIRAHRVMHCRYLDRFRAWRVAVCAAFGHVGISGIVHGLMFFLFVMGVFRRDRLGVAISLPVFFLYGGMVLTVLPRDPQLRLNTTCSAPLPA